MPVGTGTSTAQAQAATYSYQYCVMRKGLVLFWLDISSSLVCEAPPCKHHPPHHSSGGSTKV